MSKHHRRLILWVAVLVVAAGILAGRLQFSYDLGLFLPAPVSPEQDVLIERLGEAPGTRFIMIGLGQDAPISVDELHDRLSEDPLFSRILTDTSVAEIDTVPDPIWAYRYLLSDVDFSEDGLRLALRRRSADLGLLGGGPFLGLIQADPVLAALNRLERLGSGASADWQTDDGVRVLVAETQAPAFQLDAQAAALRHIEEQVGPLSSPEFEVSGFGVFGVDLRETIHAEAQQRSLLASLALMVVLLIAYHRVAPLWLAAVPLLTGALVGLAVIALVFGRIHGITLAFGFTLLGITIDYPLHQLSHSRHRPPEQASDAIWPTLRLGAMSTLLAYLAIALSGSEGLAQLGLFTCFGIAAAVMTTRWILPGMLPAARGQIDAGARIDPGLRFRHLPVMALVVVALVGVQWRGTFWNNDLSALSPIPQQRLIRDGELRAALGAPDLRHLIVLRDVSLDRLLARTHALDARLPDAVDRGWLADYRSISDLLPDPSTQIARRDRLPDSEALRQRLSGATAGTPFDAAAFEPFVDAVARTRSLKPLVLDDYRDSSLEGLVAQHLYQTKRDWVSLVALFQPIDPKALEQWLGAHFPEARLINLQRASQSLVEDYRHRTLGVLAVALAAITGLLLWRTRSRRALWVLTTMLGSVLACAGLTYVLFGPLNLYHLMGLLLVAGLGLDYALFLSRRADARDRADTSHAVWACAASTLAAFGMLALSKIPALQSMGTTVALGTALSVLSARMGVSHRGPN